MDNLRSYGTPNYYVQKLFANNRGDAVLPVKLDAASGKKLFASATHDDATGEVILKIVNGDKDAAEVVLNLNGLNKSSVKARMLTLTSASPLDENSFAAPKKVYPTENMVKLSTGNSPLTFPAHSLTVLRIK